MVLALAICMFFLFKVENNAVKKEENTPQRIPY